MKKITDKIGVNVRSTFWLAVAVTMVAIALTR